MSYQVLSFDTWPRAEHFKFYKNASNPWFNICSNLDATLLYRYCKEQQLSFYHAYLYLMQQAINSNQSFGYRIVGEQVRHYSKLSISIAILADDQMVRFCDLPFVEQFDGFSKQALLAEQRAKGQPFIAAGFVGNEMRQDVIHASVIPWLSFTSFSNARNTDVPDSIPKIVFGKAFKQDDKLLMPLSVEVHHGVMDGLHVGRFVESLQQSFDCPHLLD